MYQRQRKAWGFNGGGPGSGIYRTTRRRRDVDEADRAVCRKATRDASASTSSTATPASSTPSSKRPGATAASTAAPIAATHGTQCRRSIRGRCTSARSASTRRTRSRVYLLGSNRGFYISDDGGRDFRGRLQHHPLRGSRALDRSRRHQSSDRRRRRRRLDLVGSRPDVAVPRQPAGRPVLRDQRRHAGSVRRCAAACRTTATGACRARRARAPASPTTTASTSAAATASTRASIRPTPRTVIIESQEGAPTASTWRRSSGRRSRRSSTAATARRGRRRDGRARALELEHADRDVELRSEGALHGIAAWSSGRPTAASRGRRSAATSPRNVDRETLRDDGRAACRSARSRGTTASPSFSTLTTIGESPLDAKLLYTGQRRWARAA